jgi:hypothetical protein
MFEQRRSMRVSEVDVEKVGSHPIDLFLVASGYEERSTFIARHLAKLDARKKVALAFADRKHEICRPVNDKDLVDLGFELVEASGSNGTAVVCAIDSVVRERAGNKCHVIVDYSCMTRVWYGAIVNYLHQRVNSDIVVDFLYVPSEFSVPSPARPNRYVSVRGIFLIVIPREANRACHWLGRRVG